MAHTVDFGFLGVRERADLGDGGTVEVQCSAAEEVVVQIDHGEIPDGLRHFEFGARQHDALCRISVNEREDWTDIAHQRLANGEAPARTGTVGKGVGLYAADHAVTICVPIGSLARIRSSTRSAAPGAMRTCATPASSAASAAFSFASIPPVATPSAMSERLSAAVSTGRTCLLPSSTPCTSVRNTS